jgi:glutamate/tyrosine decarboxylase-like PLP-dependent enzyme
LPLSKALEVIGKLCMSNENVVNDSLRAVTLASEHAKDYVSSINDRRVSPSIKAISDLAHFNESLPQASLDPETVINMLNEYGSPATVASTGGRYFGLVVGGSTPASMGASILLSAWDQVAVLDASAPSAIHIERIAANWTLELLNLPTQSSVGFTTGTSVANLIGLAAARNAQYEKLGIDLSKVGMAGAPPLRIVLSEQAHVTVHKALGLLGFGKEQFITVECDKEGRMLVDKFPEVGVDTIICLQAGNVNSGASDPFVAIIAKAKSEGAWVHIDGAFGLWAAASGDRKHQVAGVELADSWAVDAHKWLNTPYDCGIAICQEPHAVHNVMTTLAPYLTQGTDVPPKDMVPEFSRRARGVEVWAAIKEMGSDGIEKLIDRCCQHAQCLAEGLQALGYEILNDVVLNQVVATIGKDGEIQTIINKVQAEGECWFGATTWQGKSAIRLSVSSWATTNSGIERTLESIGKATNSTIG